MSGKPPGLVVALTGGVAAGKSAVTRRFEALGVPVHDADVAAREVVAPGSEGLAEVVDVFGADVLDSRGQLDRPAMRRRVFADPAARRGLEAIIHPRVRAWLRERALAGTAPYCLLAIPLLAENIEQYRWVDRVLVVDVPESVQLARLLEVHVLQSLFGLRCGRRQVTTISVPAPPVCSLVNIRKSPVVIGWEGASGRSEAEGGTSYVEIINAYYHDGRKSSSRQIAGAGSGFIISSGGGMVAAGRSCAARAGRHGRLLLFSLRADAGVVPGGLCRRCVY